MSTVKIKTEPTAATAVDVQVKLEQQQHNSDIDAKAESDSEAGSEEEDIKSEHDDDSASDENQATEAPEKKRQLICEFPGCGRSLNSTKYLNKHQHEHKLQAEFYMIGK